MSKVHLTPIPNRLRRYRRVRGLRQKDVAKILGLKSTSMISRWEAGQCFPNSMNIFRLAVIYRTMVDAMFLEFLRMLRSEIAKKEELALKNKKQ